jgi:hypothetical protein
MLLRFSVVGAGGIEIIVYESKKFLGVQVGTDIMSGFMEAMQMYSEMIGSPIQQIQFSNMILFVKTYGDYTIRFLVDDMIKKEELNEYFDKTSKIVSDLIPSDHMGAIYDSEVFQQYFAPMLQPIMEKEILEDSEQNKKPDQLAFVLQVSVMREKLRLKRCFLMVFRKVN